jgi:hypothetical protein
MQFGGVGSVLLVVLQPLVEVAAWEWEVDVGPVFLGGWMIRIVMSR